MLPAYGFTLPVKNHRTKLARPGFILPMGLWEPAPPVILGARLRGDDFGKILFSAGWLSGLKQRSVKPSGNSFIGSNPIPAIFLK